MLELELEKVSVEYKKGNYELVIKLLKDLLKKKKSLRHIIYYNIGICYNQLEEREQAIVNFIKALKTNKCSNKLIVKIYYNMGMYYINRENFAQAYSKFKTAYCYCYNYDINSKLLSKIIKNLNDLSEILCLQENYSKECNKNNQYILDEKEIKDDSLSYFILYHKKNVGFELVKYTINNDSNNNLKNIIDNTLLKVECKDRDTSKYNKILEFIKDKYIIQQVILID